MIIAKIKQSGQVITLEDKLTTFQYSANLQMQFIRDDRYKDYILTGWYRCFKDKEYMLDINEDGIFTLGKDIFAKQGSVYFSFSLNKADEEIIHLGVIEYTIEQSFGNGDAILPEEQDTWISVVTKVTNAKIEELWNKDYKPQLEQNLEQIETKTSEINRTAAEVKQDAAESSSSAQNALDSANLARSSANNANLAEEKALEHMSNAEKFKNDASTYKDQADLAKTEASKSATDASGSATSALDSSNKAQQHLDNVNSKVNAFNADYASKVEDFNTSVENADTALNTKISTANTDLDKKITDTNNVLDKKIVDANTSIDGKVQVATEQANIATSKATELSQAVDKVNYLEDVVDTKLTQPYVSNPIVENATISDSDEGQLRNLKIYGKCTQKVETDIVPIPDRPVPIVSKKITVGGETVELRSLKESLNLFDNKFNGFMHGLLDSYGNLNTYNKNYASTDFISVRPNTQYFSEVFGTNIVSSGIFFFDKNKEIISKTDNRPYVTPSGCYYVRCGITINGSTLLEDLSIANNAFVFCKGGTVSNYIPQTVRDYKIVDHVSKKSWIERNVGVLDKNYSVYSHMSNDNYISFMISNTNSYDEQTYKIGFSNIFETTHWVGISNKECYWRAPASHGFILSKSRNIQTPEQANAFLVNNNAIFTFGLLTPVIEEIPYNKSDQSEFGVSSQDSNSPSPNIKSEIETITKLNIKSHGKNFLNETLAKDYSNYVSLGNGYSKFIVSVKPGTKYVVSRRDTVGLGTNCYVWIKGVASFWMVHTTNENINVNKGYITSTEDGTIEIIIATSNQEKLNQTWDVLGWLQVEEGDTATEYQPYEETAISHVLEEPLLKVGDIADTIDLNNLERTDTCKIKTFCGDKNESYVFDALDLGNATRFNFVVTDAFGIEQNLPAFCDGFDYIQGDPKNTEGFRISKGVNDKYYLWFYIKKARLKECTVSAFKEYLNNNPITVCYPATPTTEPLEPELVEKLKQLKTFYPITHIISNVPIEFDYKLNMPAWHKVVSGQAEDARDVIYNLTVKQNSLEVMQLESALETQYN